MNILGIPRTLRVHSQDCATTCHKQKEGFPPWFTLHFSGQLHISSKGFVIGCFNCPLGEVLWKDANLQQQILDKTTSARSMVNR